MPLVHDIGAQHTLSVSLVLVLVVGVDVSVQHGGGGCCTLHNITSHTQLELERPKRARAGHGPALDTKEPRSVLLLPTDERRSEREETQHSLTPNSFFFFSLR